MHHGKTNFVKLNAVAQEMRKQVNVNAGIPNAAEEAVLDGLSNQDQILNRQHR